MRNRQKKTAHIEVSESARCIVCGGRYEDNEQFFERSTGSNYPQIISLPVCEAHRGPNQGVVEDEMGDGRYAYIPGAHFLKAARAASGF